MKAQEKIAELTDEELQDEIDTFAHVCRYMGAFRVGHEKSDPVIERLEALEAEQRRRNGQKLFY